MKYTKPRRGDHPLVADPSSQSTGHVPVLLTQTVAEVAPTAKRIIDATLGAGGHAAAFLAKAPKAELLGIDQDETMLTLAQQQLQQFSDRVNLIAANFRELTAAAGDIGWDWADCIFFDLGIASPQLDDPNRGLSFQATGPLDMRLDRQQSLTAATIVNTWDERQLTTLFRTLGEEPFARPIVRKITQLRTTRPLETTQDLVRLVGEVIPIREQHRRKVHFATHVFRALRMAVNDELGALEEALPQSVDLLVPGGKLLVITFHSLEDRIVKHFVRANPSLVVRTKKPVLPSEEEVAQNPRARSAKLRVAEKKTTDDSPRSTAKGSSP